MENDKLLLVDEVAQILRLHPATVRTLVKEGKLARVMVGKREYRIRQSEVDRFINENEREGKEG